MRAYALLAAGAIVGRSAEASFAVGPTPKLLCLRAHPTPREGTGRTPRDHAPSTRRGGLVDGVEGRGSRDADRGDGVERRPRELVRRRERDRGRVDGV